MEAGNQRAANLVSLIQNAEALPSSSADWLAPTTKVMLRVRPMFMASFEPADLRAIGAQFDKLLIGARQHEVTVAPMLVDPCTVPKLVRGPGLGFRRSRQAVR